MKGIYLKHFKSEKLQCESLGPDLCALLYLHGQFKHAILATLTSSRQCDVDVFHNNKKEQITVVVNLLSDEMLENEALCNDQIPTEKDEKADPPVKNNENISVIGDLLVETSKNTLGNDIAKEEADQTQILESQHPRNAENNNDEGYINI